MQQLSFILTRNSPQKNNLGQLWIILLSSLQVSVIILIEKDKKKKLCCNRLRVKVTPL